jgi:Ulp1 family protease
MPEVCKPAKWKTSMVMPPGLPQQRNGHDCGVFALKYMERLSAGK